MLGVTGMGQHSGGIGNGRAGMGSCGICLKRQIQCFFTNYEQIRLKIIFMTWSIRYYFQYFMKYSL
ncbi:hypothetical protein CFR80_06085 [Komagataeibacter oboediens]|uniref:Uncharacterized protein n=1 Tax=Komagataeibacter oboediens TaxID=65958 RepID=A0A318QXX7_9PROT|nr:hypothetical protein CFR80_06085 [Komagataeibacter oboediens]